MTVVECLDLGRSFGDLAAVEAVSFTMEEGDFFALLGPNGAGKSTLLAMLTTLVAPSRGTARVAGADIRTDPARVRQAIGAVFQEPALDERLTARENLAIHAALPLFNAPRSVGSCLGAGDAGMAVMLAVPDGSEGWAARIAALDRPLITRCP